MNANEWEQIIREAVEEADSGDPHKLEILTQHLAQCDQAKQVLRDKGYGWTGADIVWTARMVREAE